MIIFLDIILKTFYEMTALAQDLSDYLSFIETPGDCFD